MSAESLRELASQSGLSVRQMASGSGVSKSVLGRFLQGGPLGRADARALERYLAGREQAPAVVLPPPTQQPQGDDDPVRARARQFELRAVERAAELLEDESGAVALQAIKVILSYSRGRPGQAAADDEPGAPADAGSVAEKLRRMAEAARAKQEAAGSGAADAQPG